MEPFPLTFWGFDDTLENLSPGSEDSQCFLEEENERVCLSMEPFPLTFWGFDDTLENLSPGSEDCHCVS